jgi:hypothetical protein
MLVDVGPVTANCEDETETPVMFSVFVPVFDTVTFFEPLVVLAVIDPNERDVGVMLP